MRRRDQVRPEIGSPFHQPTLRPGLDVAGEQQRAVAGGDAKHARAVVAPPAGRRGVQDLEPDAVPHPGEPGNARACIRNSFVREHPPGGPPPHELRVPAAVVGVRVADHDGVDAPAPTPGQVGNDDVRGMTGPGVVDQHVVPGFDHHRQAMSHVKKGGPRLPRPRNGRRPPEKRSKPQRARPTAGQAGWCEQYRGAGHREDGGGKRRLYGKRVSGTVRGEEVEHRVQHIQPARPDRNQKLPRRIHKPPRQRQAETPGEQGGQHGDPHERNGDHVRDRPGQRLLFEPVEDERRETHRHHDLRQPPAPPMQNRATRTRAPAHAVQKHRHRAERQPEARSKHRRGFHDQHRGQPETKDGTPGQSAAGAQRAQQHYGHDERPPSGEREAGKRRVPRRDRHARDCSEPERSHPGDEPRPRDPAGRESETGRKTDVQARDREEVGGAGLAQYFSLAVANPIADPYRERFDQSPCWAEVRDLAQPPGERESDSARIERAGARESLDPRVAGPHVTLTRVTLLKQPGLIVEAARVAKPARGPETDCEPPGLAGDQVRRVPMATPVP